MKTAHFAGWLLAVVLLAGCDAVTDTGNVPHLPPQPAEAGDLSPIDYLIETYQSDIVDLGDGIEIDDPGPGYVTDGVIPETTVSGRTTLFCFEVESFKPVQNFAFRFKFTDQRTTLVAEPVSLQTEYRGDTEFSSDAFFAGDELCGEITFEQPSELEGITIYPAIGPRDKFPFYSAETAGSVNIIRHVVVVLP